MVDLAAGGALEAAAWKVKNLEDYDARLERAARRVDELAKAHETAALVIYEAALMKSGRPVEEVRKLVREFEQTFEDEEEALTMPRMSSIMNVEREVLRRWADGYDTRLFIRRRIYETEPVVGMISGFDFPLVQYLRVAAGGDTVVPGKEISRALVALDVLGEEATSDDYAVLAAAENLALRLELPAPIVGEILHDLAVEDRLKFPEPPPETAEA